MSDTEYECPSCGAVVAIDVLSSGDEGDNIAFCPVCGSDLDLDDDDDDIDDKFWDSDDDDDIDD